MTKILNFGSLNVDHVYRVPHFVKPGETLPAASLQLFAGGKGLNQSIAAARAGAQVIHAGRVGNGGRWLCDVLSDDGVEVQSVVVDEEHSSGHAIIQVDDAGQNAIILHAGANHGLTDAQITESIAHCDDGDIVLLQNETNALEAIIRAASERGLRVCFNPAPMTDDVKKLPLEKVWLLVVNESEAAALTEKKGISTFLDDTLSGLYELTGGNIVLTLGERGCCAFDGREMMQVPATQVQAVDTTAAGDCFIGFLLAGLAGDMTMTDSLERASKAAAIAVTRQGAAASIPFRDEVE